MDSVVQSFAVIALFSYIHRCLLFLSTPGHTPLSPTYVACALVFSVSFHSYLQRTFLSFSLPPLLANCDTLHLYPPMRSWSSSIGEQGGKGKRKECTLKIGME